MALTRRDQIILLLGSRYDFTAGLKLSRLRGAQRTAQVPEAHPCERCGGKWQTIAGEPTLIPGTGTITDRYGKTVPCPDNCDHGRLRVDAYTNERLEAQQPASVYGTPYGMSFGEHLAKLIERDTRHTVCPDCQRIDGTPTGVVHGERCRRCDGTGRAPIPGSWLSTPQTSERLEGDAEAALVNAIAQRDQTGSYHQLELALAGIGHHVNKAPRYRPLTTYAKHVRRLLDQLYLPPPDLHEADLAQADKVLVELALAYIDERMPERILIPAGVAANAKAREQHALTLKGLGSSRAAVQARDKEIRKLVRQGKPTQWVAAQYGVSVRRVNQIVNGETEAA